MHDLTLTVVAAAAAAAAELKTVEQSLLHHLRFGKELAVADSTLVPCAFPRRIDSCLE